MSRHAHPGRLIPPSTLAVAVLIAGLLAAGRVAAAQEKPQAQPGDKEAVPLHWRLVPGKDFYQEVTTEGTLTMTVLQMKVTQQGSFTIWSRWSPVEERNGKWTLTQRVLGAKIDAEVGGNGFHYDSRKKGPRDAFGQVLDMLPGNTFVWTLTPSFGVEKFDGLQAFLGRALQGRPETVDRVIRTLLPARGFTEGADATFKIGLVTKARVHKGESWTRKFTRDYSPVYSLDVTCKHTYLGKQGKTEKVLVEVTEVKLRPLAANPPPADAPYKVKKVRLKSGRGSGVILFDRATGRLVSSVGEVTIEAGITLDIAGQQTEVELSQREKMANRITDTNPLK